MIEHTGRGRQTWIACGGIFVLAVLARLAYIIALPRDFDGYYWDLIGDLLEYGTLGFDGAKTTQYEPGYPVFLAALRMLSGENHAVIRLLQATVSSASAVYFYLLTEALTGRRRAAILGGLAYALYPLLVNHATVEGEGSILSLLLVAFTYTMATSRTPARAALGGLWLGLGMLTRFVVAPVAVMTAAFLVATRRKREALAMALVAVATYSPYLIRNYRLNGSLVPTRSGLNLFIGNLEHTAALLPEHTPDRLVDYAESIAEREFAVAAVGPAAEDRSNRLFTRLALEKIRERPLESLKLKVRNMAYFFWPTLVPRYAGGPDDGVEFGPDGRLIFDNLPDRPLFEHLAYTLSYSPMMLAALFGIWTRRRDLNRDVILWIVILTFAVTHAVYFPATRYRAPVSFVLIFYAAAGVDFWLRRRQAVAAGRSRLYSESCSATAASMTNNTALAGIRKPVSHTL